VVYPSKIPGGHYRFLAVLASTSRLSRLRGFEGQCSVPDAISSIVQKYTFVAQ
jgi:hypothetical protein